MQTNKIQKIILGGGIAGLIQAYSNPEAVIISDQIGGQFSSDFQLGPKYLHVDEYSKRFFEELGIKPLIKKIKIGFHYNNKLHSKNTEENRRKYFIKTRGDGDKPYESVMTGNKTEFDSFDINTEEIIKVIKEKIDNKVILEKVTKIDLENKKVYTKSGAIEYEELISTIPLNIFLFLSGKPDMAEKFKSYPTTFVLNDSSESCPFLDFSDYDYAYISEPYLEYHRVTNTDDGYVFEFRGDDIPTMKNEVHRVVLKVGQLIQNEVDFEFSHVKFFGRYASWDHSILTNILLKQMYHEIDTRNNK